MKATHVLELGDMGAIRRESIPLPTTYQQTKVLSQHFQDLQTSVDTKFHNMLIQTRQVRRCAVMFLAKQAAEEKQKCSSLCLRFHKLHSRLPLPLLPTQPTQLVVHSAPFKLRRTHCCVRMFSSRIDGSVPIESTNPLLYTKPITIVLTH